MISGQQGVYSWIEWNKAHLADLLDAFPDIARQRYVVVTSFDSGPFQPDNDELRAGWSVHGTLAYSPKITSINALPIDQFDEWYIFPEPTILVNAEVFINNVVFSLRDPDEHFPAGEYAIYGMPRHEFVVSRRTEQERFWNQIQMFAPESYVAEGDLLLFVTCNMELYTHIQHWKYPDHPA
jgi:hypothetical protein